MDLWEKMDKTSPEYITENEVRVSRTRFRFDSRVKCLLMTGYFVHIFARDDGQINKFVKEEGRYIKAFMKCSALSGDGVREVFDRAVKIALEEPKPSRSFCLIL